MTGPISISRYWQSRDENKADRSTGTRGGRIESEREAGFRLGFVAGQAASHEDYLAAVRQEIERGESALRSARQAWLIETAGAIELQIDAAMASVEARLGNAVLDVLKPFLQARTAALAVEDLAQAIAQLMRHNKACEIEIAVPPGLAQVLRTALPSGLLSRSNIVARAGACEATATVGETVVETTIGDWLRRWEDRDDEAAI